jgi:hypothetical protein
VEVVFDRARADEVPSSAFGGGAVRLLVEGPRVYAVGFLHPAGGAQTAHPSLVRSLDSGQTWRRLNDPCGDDANGECEANGRHEIDLVIDLGRRGLVAIEFKAAATVRPADATHLAWMRDRIGRRFLAGAVLHSGTHTSQLGDRLIAAPLSTLRH